MARIIRLFGPIEKGSFGHIARGIMPLYKIPRELADAGPGHPTILISSRGGNTETAIQLHELIRHAPCRVVSVGLGYVESAAVYVFLAGEVRLATARTRFMIHGGSYSASGPANELPHVIRSIEGQQRMLIEMVSERTGQTRQTVRRWFVHGMTCRAEEAVRLGIVDEIIPESYFRQPENLIDEDAPTDDSPVGQEED